MASAAVRASRATLATRSDWRVLDGFGRAVQAASRYVRPRSVDELREVMARAAQESLGITFRGAGRSYGDASLPAGGLAIDTTALDRVIGWDAQAGVIEAEPGLTIEGLWRHALPDGWWPTVVPGTMRPTLAGCVAMNVHGKNNFKVGGFGDQIDELDLVTVDGALHTVGPGRDEELFRAVVGGAGLLGAVTRVKMRMKHVESGRLRVQALATPSLDATFDAFEQHLSDADYLVGWIDCFKGGRGLGRGQVHVAHYLKEGEDAEGKATLALDRQGLPSTILGFPKRLLWRVMRPLFKHPTMIGLGNWGKYLVSRLGHGKTYLQSHVAFAFLLDYVPDWRLSYGPAGFIQYQLFVPHAEARACLRDVLTICQRRGQPSYLGVLKRHRPDRFLLTHALDGWSVALDFPVWEIDEGRWRQRLHTLTDELSERVLGAGGRFYFAKDAVMRPEDARRAWGEDKLAEFDAIRRRVDPERRLTSALARRVLGG
jgi:FAD/FMN-containing dehydrogenase